MKSTFRKIDPFWVLPYLCKVRVIVLSLGKVEFGIWMKIPFFYSNPIMKTILCDMASSTIAACAQKVLIGTGVCNGLIIGRKGAGVKWTSDPRGPFFKDTTFPVRNDTLIEKYLYKEGVL